MKCPKCLADNPPDSRFCRKCATPLPAEKETGISQTKTLQLPPAELERGTTFGKRYEIIEELGRGGMGRVYKVFDKKVKEVVALKFIRPEISTDENAIARFNNELRLARRISHRHVCRMYDLGEEGPSTFITMEYVPGEDLKKFIKRSGQLTVRKASSIARQVCEGLAEAHHLGVIHRDLKPQNIMIDSEGNTRIMDFGIARFLEGEGMTTQGIMIGTPDYMSPEQAEWEEVDERSDIYSLGVILFEMVTGRVPFEGKTPLSVAMKHKSQPPPDPRKFNAHVPEDLTQVIHKCLEKEKSLRYQSVGDLRNDLKIFEDGLSTAKKFVPKEKSRSFRKQTAILNKKKFLIPVLVVLAITIAFFVRQIIIQKETGIISQKIPEKKMPAISSAFGPGSTNTASKETSPSIRGLIPTDLEKVINSSRFSGEVQWLRRAFSMLSPEVIKHIDQEDLEGFENFLVTIRNKLPEEGSYRNAIDQVRNKLQEGKKFQDEGRQDEAEKSYQESQSQMRLLLESVRQKERADRAKTSMEQARLYASQRLGLEQDNLLYRTADKQIKNAVDSYDGGDFAGAKTLFTVLEKIFTYSVQNRDDHGSIEIMKNFVAGLRTEVNIAGIPASASWFYDRGREEEESANLLSEKKDFENAAEVYIQAAFLYEKVRENVSENKIPKR